MIGGKITKTYRNITLLLSIGLLSTTLTFAQTPPTTTENTNTSSWDMEEDDDNTSSTYKIKRKISSVSKGYRIQIYSGPDREAAKATKISFMKRFPSVRSYISYEVPYYKIKVGDFRTRKDATEFSRYLSKTYSTMVIPSLINNRIPPKAPAAPKPSADSTLSTTTEPTK